ncbi:MAG: hypothetical protein JXB34_15090 [Bacteroidales bacterium]|nr:hypothetical protein [Bacteroidales bacterium]
MILTVTLNPAIDKILYLKDFHLHKLHRLEDGDMSLISPGGKGVNIALNLKRLGNEVITSGFVSGNAGHMLCDALQQEGITTSFIFTPGFTRTNLAILDRNNETLTEINDFGEHIGQDDIDFFLEHFETLLNRIDLLIFAGSLPFGVNEEILKAMVEMARTKSIKTMVHALPKYTQSLLEASPFLIVPDMRSHYKLLGNPVDGIDQYLETGKKILEQSPFTEWAIFINRIENVVAVSRHQSYVIRPKNLKIVNMLGYGDAYFAGFVHAYLQNWPEITILQYASACGLTNVEDLYKEIRDAQAIENNLYRIEVEEVG